MILKVSLEIPFVPRLKETLRTFKPLDIFGDFVRQDVFFQIRFPFSLKHAVPALVLSHVV